MISYKKRICLSMIIGIIASIILFILLSSCRRFFIEGPQYSKKSGFYEKEFTLDIISLPGVSIYYTLDGTDPTTASLKYTSPLTIKDATSNPNVYSAITGTSATSADYVPDYLIDKATVVKSIAVIGNYQSKVSKAVFFVGFQDKQGYDNVKIMSMVINPDDFFSDEGIYVIGTLAGEPIEGENYDPSNYPANYNIESKEMRKEAHITLWDSEKKMIAEEDLLVGIHGGYSKSYLQKGFNFYNQNDYTPSTYGFDSYMLRTSGARDTFQTMFRDVLNQELVSNRNMAIQSSSPCILFLNGEFWGIYNLQQRYSESYFLNEFGISEDNIICIKCDTVSQGEESDIKYYHELIQFAVDNDLSIDENYQKISEMMDIQSFIDYNCFECYIANMDWPMNNYCCFRSRKINPNSKYEDGRWRWAPYDTDDSTNINLDFPVMGRPDSNPFTYEAHWKGNPAETKLMEALRANESFNNQFSKTFLEMANTNFDYPLVKRTLEQYAEVYRTPMVMTQHRFNTTNYTEEAFNAYVSNIDVFFKNRRKYVVPYIMETFGSIN